MTVSKLIDLLTRINSPAAIVTIQYIADLGEGDQAYRDDASAISLEMVSDGPDSTEDRVIIL